MNRNIASQLLFLATRRFLVSSLVVAGLVLSATVGICADPDPSLQLAPLTDAHLDLFRDALRAEQPFVPPQPEQSEVSDSSLSGIWSGSRANVDTEVHSVVLRFAPRIQDIIEMSKKVDNPAANLLSSFDVEVSLKGSRFELRHSAGDSRSGGGFLAIVDRPLINRTTFVGGEQGSSLYIAIPPLKDPATGWGFLVCPRTLDYVRQERTKVPVLKPSIYELTEVKATFSAGGEAIQTSVGDEGRARMSVSATSHLPMVTPHFDRARSALPQVDLVYNPKGRFDFFSARGIPAVHEGIQVLVEMQNGAGYVRKQHFLQAVSINSIREPALVHVAVDNRSVAGDDGDCYVTIVRRNSWATYGREADLF
jgi:hypothetical protein